MCVIKYYCVAFNCIFLYKPRDLRHFLPVLTYLARMLQLFYTFLSTTIYIKEVFKHKVKPTII